jgi:hypothetical protein
MLPRARNEVAVRCLRSSARLAAGRRSPAICSRTKRSKGRSALKASIT